MQSAPTSPEPSASSNAPCIVSEPEQSRTSTAGKELDAVLAARNICDQVETSSVACDIADLLFPDEEPQSDTSLPPPQKRQRKRPTQLPRRSTTASPVMVHPGVMPGVPVIPWHAAPLPLVTALAWQPWLAAPWCEHMRIL